MWVWLVALIVVKISHWLYKWSNPKCNGKLPPGSMGFPIIGETIEFFKPYGFTETHPFIKKRMARYGSLFRTNILGCNTVISTDPEVNYEIFRQENKSFILSYPDSIIKVFGKNNFFFKQGNFHKYIKHITQHFVGIDGLKRRIIHDMDRSTRLYLKSKANNGIFDVKDAVKTLIIEYMTPKLIADINPESKTILMENLRAFNGDWFGSPFSLYSWKALRNALSARRKAIQVIKDSMIRRKASKEKHSDFLGVMLSELEKEGTILEEDTVIDVTFGIMVVSYESVSTAIALALKLISKHSEVFAELKREHEAILQTRLDKESGVSWEEYRSQMSFTHMVINETLRLGTMVPSIFRKAMNDVEIKGYTIPAGWIVLVAPSILHYDSEIYENPFEFNPWRWEGKELLSGSKTFMAFGGGARTCVGAEFARLQTAIFLHHIVTKYNFSLVEDVQVTRTVILRFSNEVRVKISESCE